MAGLEKYLPKSVIENIVNPDPIKQQEHDKYVSFDTQVKSIAEFWSEENFKKFEKIVKEKGHQLSQK